MERAGSTEGGDAASLTLFQIACELNVGPEVSVGSVGISCDLNSAGCVAQISPYFTVNHEDNASKEGA